MSKKYDCVAMSISFAFILVVRGMLHASSQFDKNEAETICEKTDDDFLFYRFAYACSHVFGHRSVAGAGLMEF